MPATDINDNPISRLNKNLSSYAEQHDQGPVAQVIKKHPYIKSNHLGKLATKYLVLLYLQACHLYNKPVCFTFNSGKQLPKPMSDFQIEDDLSFKALHKLGVITVKPYKDTSQLGLTPFGFKLAEHYFDSPKYLKHRYLPMLTHKLWHPVITIAMILILTTFNTIAGEPHLLTALVIIGWVALIGEALLTLFTPFLDAITYRNSFTLQQFLDFDKQNGNIFGEYILQMTNANVLFNWAPVSLKEIHTN